MKKLLILFLILLLPGLVLADQKVVDMSPITSPASTDLLYMVANPGTTPVDRKITFGNLAISLGGQTIGATGSRVTKGWFTDLEITNAPSINGTAISANGVSLITAANYAAMKTLLGLTIGTNVQAYNANLTTWAGIAPSANIQSFNAAANYAAALALLITNPVTGTGTNHYWPYWTSSSAIGAKSMSASGLVGTDANGEPSVITALPNGTTATKQAVDDNTGKVATDSFVLAQRGREQALYDNGTCATSKTIDAANGPWQKMVLTDTDTCALTFTQPTAGTMLVHLKITQSSSGAFSGGISGGLWPGGYTPTITQSSGAVDFISCYLDGTNAYCTAGQNFK